MRILKSCQLVFMLYVGFFSFEALSTYNASSITIQRLGILGFNEDGDRGAFIFLHFGPSSQAPFASLVVMDAGNNKPIFTDAGFFLAGGESALAELAQQLIEKNKNKMEGLGINLVSPLFDEANYIVENSSPDVINGTVDIENVGQKDFSLTASAPPSFCTGMNGLTIEVCLASTCSNIIPEKIEDCWGEEILLKNIYRSKNSLWFFIFKKVTVWEGAEFYIINPAGLRF
ncbi:MAG: hypothetical protein BWZ03_00381 [bacterium ADurb.BinA186]|nr:MAG: hypothetical protein BWZ03_00381 [bacterium ADurb.BinA186]